jgi:hypothetical protein
MLLSRDNASLALLQMAVLRHVWRNGTGTRSGLNLLLKPCLTIAPYRQERNKRVGLLADLEQARVLHGAPCCPSGTT